MADHAYASNAAADLALEAQLRIKRLAHEIHEALADGIVTQDEARAMVRFSGLAVAASEHTLRAAQSVYDREVAVVSLLKVVPLNPNIRRLALVRGADLSEFDAALDNIRQFPTMEPDSAA